MNLNTITEAIQSPRLAFSYIRFSSESQSEGDSTRRQKEIALEVCKEHNWQLSDIRFQDLGVSGWTGANVKGSSGLAQFLLACEQYKIPKNSVLIVENLDRLSRQKIEASLPLFMGIMEYVDVYCNADRTLYRQGMGTMDYMRLIFELDRANRESEHKSSRLKSVWAKKRKDPNSSIKSSNSPFWLDVTEDKKSFVINDKIQLVRAIFDLRLSGMGNHLIAKTLTNRGHKSPTGKPLNPTSISNLLRDRKVLGEYRPNTVVNKKAIPTGEVFKDYYPSVISVDLFNEVQAMINKNTNLTSMCTGRGSSQTYQNLLYKKARCSRCGSSIILIKGKDNSYFRCDTARKSNLCSAGNIRIDVFYDFLKNCLVLPQFSELWNTSNEGEVAKLEAEKNMLEAEKVAAVKDLKDKLGGVPSEIAKPSLDALAAKYDEKIVLLDKNITETKHSDKTHIKLHELLEVIEQAERKETDEHSIKARLALRQLLSSFKEIYLDASKETKKAFVSVKLNDEQPLAEFESIRAITRNFDKRLRWFFNP